MTCFGFGATFREVSIGGGPGVPQEWGWCLSVDWRTPWASIPGEDMMDLPKDWRCTRRFYFGEWTSGKKTLCSTIIAMLRAI